MHFDTRQSQAIIASRIATLVCVYAAGLIISTSIAARARLNPIDDRALAVRLKGLDRQAQFAPEPLQLAIDLAERVRP